MPSMLLIKKYMFSPLPLILYFVFLICHGRYFYLEGMAIGIKIDQTSMTKQFYNRLIFI